MSRIGLARLVLSVALALTAVTAVAVVIARSEHSGARSAHTPAAGPHELTAAQAGRAFLQGYVETDGRVVRHDQGDDTVSEGQAYAMLVAAALDDEAAFDRVWSWTQKLRRPDGTLSWRWQAGRIVDRSSAADADLDAARALVIAGRRFGRPDLTAAGAALGTAILDVETVQTRLGRILVASNWATTEPYAYNPSYPSPAAIDVLSTTSPDHRWDELATGSRAVTTRLLAQVELPPDWAQVRRDGRIEATAGAAGRGDEGVRYGYDATRLPLRYAESCNPADVALAARLLAPLSRHRGSPAARDLSGQPLTMTSSVVALSAQAAVFAAAGQPDAAAAQLLDGDHLQQRSPTYYGGAWNALGRLLLTDGALGGCPPLGA